MIALFVQDQVLGIAFACIFPLLFVAMWALIGSLLGFLSGWQALARTFPAGPLPRIDMPTAGGLFSTVYMDCWVRYAGVIKATSAPQGLYLSVPFFFRLGHPTLLIPWDQIRVSRTKKWWRTYVVLTLGTDLQVPMRISEGMVRDLGVASTSEDRG